MPIDVTCTNEEKITIHVAPTTSTGKPASLDGPLRITVVSGNGTSVQGADPLAADLLSGDDPGDTTYLVEGDADLGEGIVLIQDTVTLHVTGALATNLGLTADAPTPK